MCYSSVILKFLGSKAEKNLPQPRQVHMKFGISRPNPPG